MIGRLFIVGLRTGSLHGRVWGVKVAVQPSPKAGESGDKKRAIKVLCYIFRGSLNSSNMIASDRRLVYLQTGSLVRVWGVLIRRCRQREPAKPAIRIERFSNSILNVKKYLHIRQLSFAGFAGFVVAFFSFFHDYILLSSAKISSCNILSLLFTFLFVPIR